MINKTGHDLMYKVNAQSVQSFIAAVGCCCGGGVVVVRVVVVVVVVVVSV